MLRVAKPMFIELDGETIPILYEDRSVLAIDKPAGWMLVPETWQRTNRNLQAALRSSIAAGDFWARSRQLRFVRYIHRLDAETTGILLLGKSQGAVTSLSDLFETRRMEKAYLAVAEGTPAKKEWICQLPIGPSPDDHGRMRIDTAHGKPAETEFTLLATTPGNALVLARPHTGRTHQIRLHLASGGNPVLGDPLYGNTRRPQRSGMALRAIRLFYHDPFTKRKVTIRAPFQEFLTRFGFGLESERVSMHIESHGPLDRQTAKH